MMSTWCSKHVEAYNKSCCKTRICALSWLITKTSHCLKIHCNLKNRFSNFSGPLSFSLYTLKQRHCAPTLQAIKLRSFITKISRYVTFLTQTCIKTFVTELSTSSVFELTWSGPLNTLIVHRSWTVTFGSLYTMILEST